MLKFRVQGPWNGEGNRDHHLSYSLNSSKGGHVGEYIGEYDRDTTSLAPGAPSARALWALTHNSVRVPRAYADQSIHARTTIPFVFQELTVTRASMPEPQFRSCSKSIR